MEQPLDFSTNHHDPPDPSTYHRHSANLYFPDANLSVLTGSQYFLVHEGLLCRQSSVLQSILATNSEERSALSIEGRPTLRMEESPDDMASFLIALYDGVSSLNYTVDNFTAVSALLRLATKYRVRFRGDLLRGLSASFPTTLSEWDSREAKVTTAEGVYSPRDAYPEPIMIINLAREIDAPELLPAAFYDLSRSAPSLITEGCLHQSARYHLSEDDIMSVLKGREHASRFLSTFMVNELEGREAGDSCLYRGDKEGPRRRACQVSFENITFELLRDVNGLGNRSADPLYAILDAELSQNGRSACQFCHGQLAEAVDRARLDLWGRLPSWFDIELDSTVWG